MGMGLLTRIRFPTTLSINCSHLRILSGRHFLCHMWFYSPVNSLSGLFCICSLSYNGKFYLHKCPPFPPLLIICWSYFDIQSRIKIHIWPLTPKLADHNGCTKKTLKKSWCVFVSTLKTILKSLNYRKFLGSHQPKAPHEARHFLVRFAISTQNEARFKGACQPLPFHSHFTNRVEVREGV